MGLDKTWQVAITPTDTVWGLVCRIDTEEAQQNIQRIYLIKEREATKPLILFGRDLESLKPYAHWSPSAQELADRYWPGALTIIVPRSSLLPQWVNPNEEYIGLRVPKSTSVMSLLDQTTNGLLLSTSANLSGEEPVSNYDQACAQFSKTISPNTSLRAKGEAIHNHRHCERSEAIHYVDLILKPSTQETLSNQASTIVKIVDNKIQILRQGSIKI